MHIQCEHGRERERKREGVMKCEPGLELREELKEIIVLLPSLSPFLYLYIGTAHEIHISADGNWLYVSDTQVPDELDYVHKQTPTCICAAYTRGGTSTTTRKYTHAFTLAQAHTHKNFPTQAKAHVTAPKRIRVYQPLPPSLPQSVVLMDVRDLSKVKISAFPAAADGKHILQAVLITYCHLCVFIHGVLREVCEVSDVGEVRDVHTNAHMHISTDACTFAHMHTCVHV